MDYPKMKILTKPDLVGSLKAMPIGEAQSVGITTAKAQVIRCTVANLKGQGYDFTVSEAGRTTDTIVTRIK